MHLFVAGDDEGGFERGNLVQVGDPLVPFGFTGLGGHHVHLVVGQVPGDDRGQRRDIQDGGFRGIGLADPDDQQLVALQVDRAARQQLRQHLLPGLRSALRRLTDAAPAMPAEVARRVVAADLAVAYGPGWQDRLVAFDDIPAAAASIGQVHRGQWRTGGGQVVQVAVKVQYPGVGQALRSDLRQARLLARVMARLTRLNVSGLADELAGRIVEELDYVREGRVQAEVAAAFTDRLPEEIAAARASLRDSSPAGTSGTSRASTAPPYGARSRGH